MEEQEELKVAQILGQRAEELERATNSLVNYLRYFCQRLVESEPDFRFRFVEGRDKKPPEVARALKEQGLRVDDVLKLDDLVGGRVVVVSPSDVQDFVEAARKSQEFPVRDFQVSNLDETSGYRATHLKGWMDSRLGRLGCEIQIRTAIADAWSVVSRVDLYHSNKESEFLREVARSQARVLAGADDALELIRTAAKRPRVTGVEAFDRREEKPDPQVIQLVGIPSEERVATPSVVHPRPLDKEVYVQENAISAERRDGFYQSFLEDRRNAAATEKVFRQADAFVRSDEWKDSVAAGFNALVHKGPFVEGSNWLPYHTWSFAVAAEVHLLSRLRGLLEQSAAVRMEDVELSWRGMLAAVDKLSHELKMKGYTASIIVIAAQLGVDLMVDLHNHAVPHWELPEELRAPWIEGVYQDVPILNMREQGAAHTLYVADLSAFAKLTKYGPDAEFNLKEIDEGRAKEILGKKPDAVVVPEGRPNTKDEKLRLLQLRVWLRLYESYGIEVKNPEAVLGARVRPDGT